MRFLSPRMTKMVTFSRGLLTQSILHHQNLCNSFPKNNIIPPHLESNQSAIFISGLSLAFSNDSSSIFSYLSFSAQKTKAECWLGEILWSALTQSIIQSTMFQQLMLNWRHGKRFDLFFTRKVDLIIHKLAISHFPFYQTQQISKRINSPNLDMRRKKLTSYSCSVTIPSEIHFSA